MNAPTNLCIYCRRFDDVTSTCAAFAPGVIPDEIWSMQHDHRKPFTGDKGLTFVPDTENLAAMTAGDKAFLGL